MAKQVFDSKMVAHVWAQQNQQHGRNKQHNFYFTGDTIYSYGSHFPIAVIVTRKSGKRCVLFTTDGSSVTTSKHINWTRQAVRHLSPVFHVSLGGTYLTDWEANDWHEQARRDYAKRIAAALDAATRAHAPSVRPGRSIPSSAA